MTVTGFLRRSNTTSGNDEYLILTIDTITTQGSQNLIAPQIPGNDSSSIQGTGGTNFLLPIGNFRIRFQLRGTLVDIAQADMPTLPSASVFLPGLSSTPPTTTFADQTREALADFFADQGASNLDDTVFGYPEWAASGGDLTMSSTDYTLWEGNVEQFKANEVAGEPGQLSYSLTFLVGDETT